MHLKERVSPQDLKSREEEKKETPTEFTRELNQTFS